MFSIGFMLLFGGVSGATYLVIQYVGSVDRRIDNRLRELTGDHSGIEALRSASHTAIEQTFGGVFRQYRKIYANRDSFEVRLTAAGVYSRKAVTLFLASRLAVLILPPTVCIALAGIGILGWRTTVMLGCLLGLLAIVAPGAWLSRRIAIRTREISGSMADFLDLCIVCLDGGLSLQATMRRVTGEIQASHPVLSQELMMVLRDVDMGITIGDSMRRFADRSNAEFVRTFSTFVRETQRFGTPLADAMREFAETLRIQSEHAAEERAQKAAVKILLPTLLFLFPAVFVVVVGPAVIQIYEALSP